MHDTNHMPAILPVEIHIDGDTIKGPRCDGYPFLAENVDAAYIKMFAAAPAMLAAARDVLAALPEFERAGHDAFVALRAAIDSAEGR
jgi:hypothetical protein